MKLSVVMVSPDLAQQWLLRNHNNRPIRPRRVAGLARDMAAGRWASTGDTIKFAQDGALLDGQHRLHAVLHSGCTVEMAVAEDLDPDARVNVDTHAKRTFADVLTFRGESNVSTLAAATRLLCVYRGQSLRSNNVAPTNDELIECLAQNPGLRQSAVVAGRISRTFRGPTALYAVAHYLLTAVDVEDANFFFARLLDGVGLPEESPILALRRWMENATIRRLEVSAYERLGFIFKAWNAYRDGKPVRVLIFKTGGAAPEAFPHPR